MITDRVRRFVLSVLLGGGYLAAVGGVVISAVTTAGPSCAGRLWNEECVILTVAAIALGITALTTIRAFQSMGSPSSRKVKGLAALLVPLGLVGSALIFYESFGICF